MDTSITKTKSLSLKAIAIILMYFLHVFAYPERIYPENYIGLFKINNIYIEQYIGMFGSICVMMFLFLSGYGLYIKENNNIKIKSIIKRIIKFYINFWIIFILFITIGYMNGKYTFNLKEFIFNFIGIKTTYNGEWWFISLYIFLIIIYPILIKLINKLNFKLNIGLALVYYCIGMILVKLSILFNINILNNIGNFISWWIYFIMGILVCKYGVFYRIKGWLRNKNLDKKSIYILLLGVCIFLNFSLTHIPIINYFNNIIILFLFMFSLVNITTENKIIVFIGENSTNMWLIHSFFCYYFWSEFTYKLKYSMLILIQIIIITIIISICINFIIKKINIFLFERKHYENMKRFNFRIGE